jgi:hypothetical protein
MNDNNIILMEITFNIIYLFFIWTFVFLMIKNRKGIDEEYKSFSQYYLIGFFLLALGDTGHVGFRVIAHLAGGLEQNSLLVGLGALSTAITITFLYVLLLEAWRLTFNKERDKFYYFLFITAIIRLLVFIPPPNKWGSVVPPFGWSLARNIPLVILGLSIAFLLLKDGKANKEPVAIQLSICIFISYGFYIPVILFVQIYPLIGMLMIPKTIAYMIMAWLVYKYYFKQVKSPDS